jgi:hypothetical protein
MFFFWGLWAGFGAYVALELWSSRRRAAVAAAAAASACAVFFVLVVIDNSKSERYDCFETVDPNTGDDVLSCRTDHWLPTRVWRVINRF